MPSSREIRRRKTQTASDKNIASERKQKRPLLYFGSIILLVIIVVTFVGSPLLSRLGGGGSIIFGKYGNIEIDFVPGNYLSQQRDILYDQAANSSSSSESFEWQAYRIWRGAFERTVIRTAILYDARKAGMYVSDNRIDETLLVSGPYMENGLFSETRYKNTTNAEKYRYRNLFNDEIIHRQYMEDVLHVGFTSSSEAEFFSQMGREKRKFRYGTFKYADFPEIEVVKYGQENAIQFRKIKLSRITVRSGQNDAETIRTQILDDAATFEDQARNHSVDGFSEKGGEMGWRQYNTLAGDFTAISDLDSLFALSKGKLSPVYETSFGFVFYRIDETTVEPDFSSEETIADIRRYMGRLARGVIEDHLMTQAEAFQASAAELGFANAASQVSLAVFETEKFPVNYGNSYYFAEVKSSTEGQSLQSAAYDELFFTTLFSLNEGEVSDPIVLDEEVGVFQLMEISTEVEEETIDVAEYYPFILQQNLEQDYSNSVFVSDLLQDNFSEVFTEVFTTP